MKFIDPIGQEINVLAAYNLTRNSARFRCLKGNSITAKPIRYKKVKEVKVEYGCVPPRTNNFIYDNRSCYIDTCGNFRYHQ